MKFTTATALLAISASVASAAPAYNTQVPISKAATITSSSVDQPSIILDYYTTSSTSDKTTASAVTIQPIGQESVFTMASGISIHTSVPTTIVSNGKTTVSTVASVSFLHFGPGPARISTQASATSSSAVATSTSTPAIERLQAQSTAPSSSSSSGLPFTLHFGFPAQATKASSSAVATSSSTSTSASHAASSYVIPSYKTTIYSTIYAKPSTISVVAPKSTITSVVSIPGTKYTVTETVHHSSSATPYVSSSSGRESATYNNYAAAASSSSSSSSTGLPFTLHYGFLGQKSTLVTSVRSSTTAESYAASTSISSSSAAGLPFTLHYGFPMRKSSSSSIASATPAKSTVQYGQPTQSVTSIPVVYTTTSYIKTTPIAAYTSAPTTTASSTTKKSYFGIF